MSQGRSRPVRLAAGIRATTRPARPGTRSAGCRPCREGVCGQGGMPWRTRPARRVSPGERRSSPRRPPRSARSGPRNRLPCLGRASRRSRWQHRLRFCTGAHPPRIRPTRPAAPSFGLPALDLKVPSSATSGCAKTRWLPLPPTSRKPSACTRRTRSSKLTLVMSARRIRARRTSGFMPADGTEEVRECAPRETPVPALPADASTHLTQPVDRR